MAWPTLPVRCARHVADELDLGWRRSRALEGYAWSSHPYPMGGLASANASGAFRAIPYQISHVVVATRPRSCWLKLHTASAIGTSPLDNLFRE